MSVVGLNHLDFQASGARLEVKTSGNSKFTCRSDLVPGAHTLDSAIHWINHYPVDRYQGTNCVVHWIEIYPMDSVIQLSNKWALESTNPS